MIPDPKLDHELFVIVDKYVQIVRLYGFETDQEEVFYLLGRVVLVCQHKIPRFKLKGLLGMTLLAEIKDIPFQKREKVLVKWAKLYVKALRRIRESSQR